MTFGISRDAGAFEWSGTSPAALFAQSSNILSLSFWRMIFDIIRFNEFALDLLSSTNASTTAEMSVGEYLEREGYSDAFRDDYLIPMTACVWSTGADKCALEFPALTLVRFMWNHHLLSTISTRPPWLTVEGGAKRYIQAIIAECKNATIHLDTPVESLSRRDGRVEIKLGGKRQDQTEIFDEVILACHGDQARWIVGDAATLEEKEILGAFETTPNIAYLHNDLSLMPRRRKAWSAWNYLTTSAVSPSSSSPSGSLQTVSLTYNMNILQHISPSKFSDVLVTLNPENPPSPALTQATYDYRHPLYNSTMIAAQEKLERIQGKKGIWYIGAYTGYGFHEDGCRSGIQVGQRLGGSVPFDVVDAKFMRGLKPEFGWKDYIARLIVWVLQTAILVFEKIVGVKRQGSTRQTNGQVKNGKIKEL